MIFVTWRFVIGHAAADQGGARVMDTDLLCDVPVEDYALGSRFRVLGLGHRVMVQRPLASSPET